MNSVCLAERKPIGFPPTSRPRSMRPPNSAIAGFRKTNFEQNLPIMNFDELLQFVERDMRMAHVYQPVMLRELLSRNGRASVADIARALLNEDRSQIEYYSEITKNMVGRVLPNRTIVKRDGGE